MDKKTGNNYIGIAVLGLGVVGSGFVKALLEEQRAVTVPGTPNVHLTHVLVRDVEKKRLVDIDKDLLTNDFSAIVDDSETNVIVEVLGGEEPAATFLEQALSSGKHVVTANKEVVAKHGRKLIEKAQANNVEFRYEASVGAGIPIISALQGSLASDYISGIWAIINGTTNYILTSMASGGLDFDGALSEAQVLGYAEPDPTNDVEGFDARYKLAILASLGFGTYVDPSEIYCEGINSLHARDFKYARELGYAIKLLAIAREEMESIQIRVHPALLREDLLLAKVDGVYNAIQIQGERVGRLLMYGRGAGSEPTTSGLLGDVAEVVRRMASKGEKVAIVSEERQKTLKPISDLHTSYYLRISVLDQAGVLAAISQVFAKWDISIGSVIQKESDDISQTAELVVLTHVSKESAVQQAAKEILGLAEVESIGSLIRVESDV